MSCPLSANKRHFESERDHSIMYELAINLKTAKAPQLLARADEVIE